MMKNILLTLIVFGIVGCAELNSSKDSVINLSCSFSETTYLDRKTLQTFKTQRNSSKSFRFAMEINKTKRTIKTSFMGDFQRLNETELEYSAHTYKFLNSDEATHRLTIDRMSLKWMFHTFDSNILNLAPANGEPEKQASFMNGQCYRANKI